ncbi:MAG: choice-of-anchor U domain-containing protein, partial [Luminiphilus sp.]
IKAMLNASSSNQAESSDRFAQVSTEVIALPTPVLAVSLETLPEAAVPVGDEFKVLIEVVNRGTVAADTTTVTLDVPAGASFVHAIGEGTESGGVITWTVNDLPPGDEAAQLVAAMRSPASAGGLELHAVASTDVNGKTITDTATESLMVTGEAVLDLQLALGEEESVAPGDLLDLEYRFQNIGNTDADNVTLSMATPADTTLQVFPDYAACAGTDDGLCAEGYTGNVTLDIGTMEPGERDTAIISLAVVEAPTSEVISVSASLSGQNADEVGSELEEQVASATLRILAPDEPMLAVSQRASRVAAAPGQTVLYTIDYQNLDSDPVGPVEIVADIPADTVVSAYPGGVVSADGGQVSWQSAQLKERESGTVLLEVKVAGNAEVGATLFNIVTIASAETLAYANNVPVKVVGDAANLESSIESTNAIRVGDEFTYAVNFSNAGTSVAAGATLQLQLSEEVSVEECDGCAANGNRLSWPLGDMPARETGVKVVSVRAKESAANTLYALSYISDESVARADAGSVAAKLDALRERMTARNPDEVIDRVVERSGPVGLSAVSVDTDPTPSPSLGALDIEAPEQALVGEKVPVSLSVSNEGSAEAVDVTLTAQIPDSTTLDSVLNGGTCSADPCAAGATLSWTFPVIEAGQSSIVGYVLASDAASVGDVIKHQAALPADSSLSRSSNATASTRMVAADLRIEKTATGESGAKLDDGASVSIGEQVTYTLRVVNDNPVAQAGIRVTDQLPDAVVQCGSACFDVTTTGASLTGDTLNWADIDLDAGAALTLPYTVTIPEVASGTELRNLASVRSDTGSSDADSASVRVAAEAALSLSMSAPAVIDDGGQGRVSMTYRNSGTAGTAATLRYVLPQYLSMVNAGGASASGSAYTFDLGNLAAGASGSVSVVVAASGPGDARLNHSASLRSSTSNLSADAVAVSRIGVREEVDLTISAPDSMYTGDRFTTTLVASNTGNVATNGATVTLLLPDGFTVTDAAGGTVSGQVLSWTLNLAAGASTTLSPELGSSPDAGGATLLADITTANGVTESASASLHVDAFTAAIVRAGAQFSVAQAKAGDTIVLAAGPANIGAASSGAITNTVTFDSGVDPIEYGSASWSASDRTLSWTTSSLAARGTDVKAFKVRVANAGPLAATITSNDASGEATAERSFPEEVTIKPEDPDSTCVFYGLPVVEAAPEPPAKYGLAFPNSVGFAVIDCDRNPNGRYPETLNVTIDVGQPIGAGARLFKIDDSGQWSEIYRAIFTEETVTYQITDDGDLDQDKRPGIIRDPVVLVRKLARNREIPIPSVPLWLLGLLA